MKFKSQSKKQDVFYPQLENSKSQARTSSSRQPSDVNTYFMAGFLHHEETKNEKKVRY
jgi:hypothetical protein